MESQKIDGRYLDTQLLDALLRSLFGVNFKAEVR